MYWVLHMCFCSWNISELLLHCLARPMWKLLYIFSIFVFKQVSFANTTLSKTRSGTGIAPSLSAFKRNFIAPKLKKSFWRQFWVWLSRMTQTPDPEKIFESSSVKQYLNASCLKWSSESWAVQTRIFNIDNKATTATKTKWRPRKGRKATLANGKAGGLNPVSLMNYVF